MSPSSSTLRGLSWLAAALCASAWIAAPAGAQVIGNVLLVVGDDAGTDMVGCYGVNPNHPPTPTIDGLAADGLLFRRAYTDPTCSPTRAEILTGRYGFRTLLGAPIHDYWPEFALPQSEITLAEILHRGQTPIAMSAIGKWHLGSTINGGPDSPNLQGFDWFGGTLGNFELAGEDYYHHTYTRNGVQSLSTTYATIEQADDAIARIQAMPQPWFCYLAFNAPHFPLHAPPSALHSYSLSGDPTLTPVDHFSAAVQAMDHEFGRVLASMSADVRRRTTVIFLGDNGTPNDVLTPPVPAGRGKGTLYEGGVHVPLIFSGFDVRPRGVECASLVNLVDLFPTIVAMLGVDMRAALSDDRDIDGVDMRPYLRNPLIAPLRTWVFAEKFSPNGPGPYTSSGHMLRDSRWKLIQRVGQADLFYDMQGLDWEGPSLLPGALTPVQQAAYDALSAQLADLTHG
jgi:arylsulfatase A-like enzyme